MAVLDVNCRVEVGVGVEREEEIMVDVVRMVQDFQLEMTLRLDAR